MRPVSSHLEVIWSTNSARQIKCAKLGTFCPVLSRGCFLGLFVQAFFGWFYGLKVHQKYYQVAIKKLSLNYPLDLNGETRVQLADVTDFWSPKVHPLAWTAHLGLDSQLTSVHLLGQLMKG
jgi:hypothetical protein